MNFFHTKSHPSEYDKDKKSIGEIGMEELLERVFSFTDIDKLIDFISYELQKPVILESADFFLLAYNSYYINHFDSANQQTIFSKNAPCRFLKGF